ncbi:MAG: hypothetical protein FWD68_05075 [Alphaproteobacteria bacterium]|nr:hypothetical protein [Alphaproteobacteria bacterium]
MPGDYGEQTVAEFFDMVRGIVTHPDRWQWYDEETIRKNNEKYFPKLAEVLAGDGEPSPLSVASARRAFQQADREKLLRELDDFHARFQDCLDEAFAGRFKWSNGKRYIDRIRAIVADPNCCKTHE